MITMDILGKIRRMYLRDKLSLHEISKRTGLSRNTIRSWLRKSDGELSIPSYQRGRGPLKLSPYQADSINAHRILTRWRCGKVQSDIEQNSSLTPRCDKTLRYDLIYVNQIHL